VTALAAPSASSPARDRWLPLGRALGLLVLALAVGLALFDIPFQLVHDQTLCAGPTCSSDQLSPADLVQLQQAGLTLSFLAIYQVAVSTITVLAFAAVGALIWWRRSRDWFGVLTAIALAGAGFTLTIGGSPFPAVVNNYPALIVPVQLLNLTGTSSLFAFFYLFPDGHFAPRWIAWLMPLVIVHEVVKALRPELLGSSDLTAFPAFLSVIFVLVYRYRRVSNIVQRQQTKWVVFGSIGGLAGAIALIGFFTAYPNVASTGAAFLASSSWYLFLLLIPFSIGMAILRSHLWDIDVLIRRTLVYGALTALLALVYLGAVIGLQAVFASLTPLGGAQAAGSARSELVTVLSTLVIAALFVPLRGRLQAAIDQRFYRRKYDAARTLAQFGAGLRDEVNLENLSTHLLDAVDETMQPERVGLWLKATPGEGRTK